MTTKNSNCERLKSHSSTVSLTGTWTKSENRLTQRQTVISPSLTVDNGCVRLCPTVSGKQWDGWVKRLFDRVPPYYYVVRGREQSIPHPGKRAMLKLLDRFGHSRYEQIVGRGA